MKFPFPFEIKRTNRKCSIAIQIINYNIKVIAPRTLSDKKINEFVINKKSWIEAKLKLQSEYVLPKAKKYINDEIFSYLGDKYSLKIIISDSPKVKLEKKYIKVPIGPKYNNRENWDINTKRSFIKDALAVWYTEQAYKCLLKKTKYYSAKLGVYPKTIKVSHYKSRWGSCSITGDISYNWRIISAPHFIINYLVVHELCHLLEMNHSRSFWQNVESLLPDYKKRRKWLKLNSNTLFF